MLDGQRQARLLDFGLADHGEVKLWDTQPRQELPVLKEQTGSVRSLGETLSQPFTG
jgi:hypothetical protein